MTLKGCRTLALDPTSMRTRTMTQRSNPNERLANRSRAARDGGDGNETEQPVTGEGAERELPRNA